MWYGAVVSHHPATRQRCVLAEMESVCRVSAVCCPCHNRALLPVTWEHPFPLGPVDESLGVPCNVEDFIKHTIMNLSYGILFLIP